MEAITVHGLDELILTRVLGWKWVSFVGIPVKGTEGYPKECRVRQLVSPKTLESKRWQEYLKRADGREATGDEPLAYVYCSSYGPEAPPRLIILVDDQ